MKKLIFLMFICIAFTVKCLAQNAENDTVTTYNNYSLFSDSVIAFGKNYLSVPYRSGGMSANGFDCSGFTSFVYKNFGYQLARTSDGQAQQVNKIKKDDLQRGDLVFFNGRKRGARIGHVGMITDVKTDGSFDFIHASVKGVRITNSEQNYYKQRYMGAGRVFADANQLSKRQKPDKKTEKQKNETEATEIKTETETKVVTQEIAEIKEL
ncbi:MAG: C40 family peptidase, partial [Paludibacter sp.]|nr:C40 family peptidase [Paludibacter sp.]